jgi:hypothetical protein
MREFFLGRPIMDVTERGQNVIKAINLALREPGMSETRLSGFIHCDQSMVNLWKNNKRNPARSGYYPNICIALGLNPATALPIEKSQTVDVATPADPRYPYALVLSEPTSESTARSQQFMEQLPYPQNVPASRAEVDLILSRRNNEDPYNCLKIAIDELSVGMDQLPETDLMIRSGIGGAIAMLKALLATRLQQLALKK